MPRAYLFEQAAINEYPANLGSADAEYIVTAEDGMDYVVKTTAKRPMAPASEWMCHNIADACAIATPQFTLIKLLGGAIGFGSQWDASVGHGVLPRVTLPVPGPLSLAKKFSEIYALDLIVYNRDRHLGNYFFVHTNKGIGVKAYDFSRALFHNGWPLPALPMDRHCNTVACYTSLRVGYPFEQGSADQLIQRISSIKRTQIDEWLSQMPSDWLSGDLRKSFSAWWESALVGLVKDVSEGLGDGRYL